MKFTLAAIALSAMFVASPAHAKSRNVPLANDDCYQQCQQGGNCNCMDEITIETREGSSLEEDEREACDKVENSSSPARGKYRTCRTMPRDYGGNGDE